MDLNWGVQISLPNDANEVAAEDVAAAIVRTFQSTIDGKGYKLTSSGADIILEEKVADGDDPTLNISIKGKDTGVPDSLTSEHTRAGSIGVTEEATLTFNSGASATANLKVTVGDEVYTVAVSSGDTPDIVAGKVRTVLSSQGVTGYTVGGTGADVVFTSTGGHKDVDDLTVTVS